MECAQLATQAVLTVLWPAEPPEPTPLPIETATLSVGVRIALAGSGSGDSRLVSESLGAYSYRLSPGPALEEAVRLTATELEMLEPWLRPGGVYQLDTAPVPALPWNWFQHDLDQLP